MTTIYHLTTEKEFFAQLESEEYVSAGFEAEGFMHFSQEHQILGVANRFYREAESPILLVVEVEKLTAPVKYEPPIHPRKSDEALTQSEDEPSDLFPHLYGKLNKTAIINILPMRRDESGEYIRVF